MTEEVVPPVPDEADGAAVGSPEPYLAVDQGDVPEMVTDADRSWWTRLVAWVAGEIVIDENRLERLSAAITRQPYAPANYVLRGELYLQAGEPDLAMEDFLTALDLATDQFEREDWGVLSQVMRDRAERGLGLARRRLKKR